MSKHDASRVYEKLTELYQEAQAVHQASGNALVEIINTLSRKAEADAAFLAAFHHLIPREIAPDPEPAHEPEPAPIPRSAPSQPPPLYGFTPSDSDDEFESRLQSLRGVAGRGA